MNVSVQNDFAAAVVVCESRTPTDVTICPFNSRRPISNIRFMASAIECIGAAIVCTTWSHGI